jgi:hypothetical protein
MSKLDTSQAGTPLPADAFTGPDGAPVALTSFAGAR